VAGLDAAAAAPAAADLDLEAGHQRPHWRHLLLALGRHPLHHQPAAAAWTARRQVDLDDPVDVGGWLAVRVPAVSDAWLAATPLGVGHRGVLGERGSLPLGRPAQRLHLPAQPLVALPQPLDLITKLLVALVEPLLFPSRSSTAPRSRSRSCRSSRSRSRNAAFSSFSSATRWCSQPGLVASQPVWRTPGCLAMRLEGYNPRIRRQEPANSIPLALPTLPAATASAGTRMCSARPPSTL
jgi:hypothetical protein